MEGLIRELQKLPKETEWVEFKRNNSDPQEIGEYISALSNSAALVGKVKAYLLWGIDDETHDVRGTRFVPSRAKKGDEELENWLLKLLEPKIDFQFHELEFQGLPVVLLEIERALRHPVRFSGQEYVRVGSYKKALKDHPERERRLWRVFDQVPFEHAIALENAESREVLDLLDWQAYFRLLNVRLPIEEQGVLQRLAADAMIVGSPEGRWNICNLGAVLFASRLSRFRTLERKQLRVIRYSGRNRVRTSRELEGTKGYGSGFEELIDSVNDLLPRSEVIGKALRSEIPAYPELAIRELVANALVHQDFFQTGNGPVVEIFDDRVEITNPGSPLVETDRFLNSPPKSRNEALASFLRRVGICEERGSGIDKVVSLCEECQLPAPEFLIADGSTRAVLFAPRPLNKMDRSGRVRACYQHACLKYEEHDFLTNTSVRARFGLDDSPSSTAIASRYIKEAIEDRRIRVFDSNAPPRYRKYLPVWAS
jgi:predicted HTH transcriptional regulator